jgi:hypothetical protein
VDAEGSYPPPRQKDVHAPRHRKNFEAQDTIPNLISNQDFITYENIRIWSSWKPEWSSERIKEQDHSRLYAAIEEAERRNYPHPYLMMAEWANDESKPLEIRATMLQKCASYRGIKPKQTVAIGREVPTFTTEEQAQAFLAEFISAMAPDLEPAEIASMTKQWIESNFHAKILSVQRPRQPAVSAFYAQPSVMAPWMAVATHISIRSSVTNFLR